MENKTKEEKQELLNKMKKIGLDLDNIPNIFKVEEKITYLIQYCS